MRITFTITFILSSLFFVMAQVSAPQQNMVSGGSVTGANHQATNVPTHFSVIGQPFARPLFLGGSGSGFLTVNELIFAGSITDANIVSLVFEQESKSATIDDENFTVSAEVVFGTDVSSLTPTIVVSPGASISPASNSAQDFTNPVAYTVTAADGETTQQWTVTVTIAPNTATDFLSFELPQQNGNAQINSENHTIGIELPFDTDVTGLIATFNVSEGATVNIGETNQISGTTPNDFSNPVTYRVMAQDEITFQDWLVTVTIAPNTATDFVSFSLPNQQEPASIDIEQHTIRVLLPFGSDLSNLVATYSLSPGATASVEGINQVSEATANNFETQVNYLITAEDGTTTQTWIVIVSDTNTAADITSFSFVEQSKPATIDDENFTVSAEVVFGTNVSSLIPTIVVSPGASISPASNAVQDFTNSVVYTVTAADGETTQQWTVTVTIAPNTATDFLSFEIPQQNGNAQINSENHTIGIEVPFGTEITQLIASFTVSEGASVSIAASNQISGTTPNDFTNPVTYRVMAQDEITFQDWIVTVSIAPNTATDFISFSIPDQQEPSNINTEAHTIQALLPFGSDLSSLVATFSLSHGATASVAGLNQVSGTTANNFENTVNYLITAEDGTTTQTWIVTVSAINTATAITSFSFTEQTGPASIDDVEHAIEIEVEAGTNPSNLVATFSLSIGATATVSGTLQVSGSSANNFSNPLSYVVTAQDEVTIQAWIVTVTVANSIPTDILLTNQKIPDTNLSGTIVGELFTVDLDTEDTHAYQIVSGANSFSISNGNKLVLLGKLNVGNHDVTIESSDGSDVIVRDFVVEVLMTNVVEKVSFGGKTKDFRMISMPFQTVKVNAVFPEITTATFGKTWKMLNFNGSTYQDLNVNSDMIAGKGYWFLSTEETEIIVPSATPAILNSNLEYELSLTQGWNIIGNPYLQAINISQIVNYNVDEGYIELTNIENSGSIFTYNGGYAVTNTLEPFEGAWIKTAAPVTLHIPSPTAAASSGRVVAKEEIFSIHQSKFESDDQWEILISIESDQEYSLLSGFGMHPQARAGIDFYDLTLPPTPDQSLTLTLIDPVLGVSKNILKANNSAEWSFELIGNTSQVKLSWDQTVASKLTGSVVLLIGETKQFVDMKKTSSIQVTKNQIKDIKILYGELKNDHGLFTSVYPNPSDGLINLEIHDLSMDKGASGYQFEIFKIDGSSVFVTHLPIDQAKYQIDLSTFGLSKGLYIYRVNKAGVISEPMKLIVK